MVSREPVNRTHYCYFRGKKLAGKRLGWLYFILGVVQNIYIYIYYGSRYDIATTLPGMVVLPQRLAAFCHVHIKESMCSDSLFFIYFIFIYVEFSN
jgi:hypothetical protein